jgi:oligopeptide/dipeptide ABC transporter ATP-binding protein
MENKNILEVKNLTLGFEIERAIKQIVYGVDFELKKGQVLTILGESGCGKSVLGAAILKLLPYNAVVKGEIYFDGEEILHLPEAEFRSLRGMSIAVALQGGESGLDPLVKIGKQSIEGLKYHTCVTNEYATACVEEMLLTLGLSNPKEIMNRYPYQLSGGMNQRVLLGMTAVLNPQFLLLDEPTKGLDAASKLDTLNALKGLRSKTESAILLITHDIELAKEISDQIMVMYAGQIVEILSPCDLKKPQHPYTAGLLASSPEGGFIPISGYAPDSQNMPQGCHFSPRCKYATCNAGMHCNIEVPEFSTRKNGYVRCFMEGEYVT